MRTSLLLEISDAIEATELESMKNSCHDYAIPARRLEEITEAYELFDELKQRCLLTPEMVVKLLEKAGRIDLKDKVLETEAPSREESRATVSNLVVAPSVPIANAVLKYTHFNDISENLGRDWRPLGRKLGIPPSVLDNINLENDCIKDKAFKVLSRWRKRSGKDATAQTLANALIATGRKDVAEALARLCEPDGINIHISEESVHLSQNSRTDSGGLDTMQADLARNLPPL